ncbi:hypothetical protein [Actinomadura rubteroloni]|uniref:hypothetical protein n=1 Tax=Actinomadura rubteroloni TaxID=1926885 RepID=UPI00196A2168|nr:hypothetical protein [Actinomadura rubteroloni]
MADGRHYVEAAKPWELAKAERKEQAAPQALDAVLAELVATCRDLAHHMTLFPPARPNASTPNAARVPPASPIPNPYSPAWTSQPARFASANNPEGVDPATLST